MQGLRSKYEEHHGVTISDDALEAATDYAIRYINDRFLPDKAIDLIDEAASRLNLSSMREREELFNDKKEKLEELQQEKENAVAADDMEYAIALRKEEVIIEQELAQVQEKWEKKQKKKQIRM